MILGSAGIVNSRRGVPPVVDAIRAAIGPTYQTAYDAATVDNWVEVNSTAYNNVLTLVTGATIYGFSEAVMTGPSGTGWGPGFMVSNNVQVPIPINNYIIAWSCIPNNNGTQILYTASTLSSTVYTRIGDQRSVTGTAGARKYFVRKAPTTATTGDTYVGWYSSSGMQTRGPNTVGQVYKSAGATTVSPPFSTWGGSVPAPGLQYLVTSTLSW